MFYLVAFYKSYKFYNFEVLVKNLLGCHTVKLTDKNNIKENVVIYDKKKKKNIMKDSP